MPYHVKRGWARVAMKLKKLFYISAPILAWAVTVLVIYSISQKLSSKPLPPQGWNPIGTSGFGAPFELNLPVLPKLYVVQSGSMEPKLKLGSLVIVKPQESYAANDVITFSPEGGKETITHRIAMRRYPEGTTFQPTYITKGDANEEIDRGEVKNENVVGKVVLSVPFLGYGVDFAKKPYGFILLVIVPATIIVYEEIRSLLLQLWQAVKKIKIRKKERTPLPKASILVPSLGAFLIFVGISGAYFFDIEESLANVLGVAESFEEGNVVINEFLPNPDDPDDASEWIELYNVSSYTVNLNSWVLDDIVGGSSPFPLTGKSIAGNDYLVVEKSESGIGLNNSGDTVRLIGPDSNVVDEHSYSTTTETVSIGRETDGNLPWKDCGTPTKGATNNGSC